MNPVPDADPVRELKTRLELERLFGQDSIPFCRAGKNRASLPVPAWPEPADRPAGQTGPPVAGDTLEAVRAEVSACTLCPLCKSRTRTVFGTGSTDSVLMFVGEGPGADEDQQGEPFVGRAGQLLNKIIETTLDLKREEVYIANVVKCRPPGNRNPAEEEINRCMPYLFRQLKLIRPRIICALGRIAAGALLETDVPIGKLRGRFHPMPCFDGIEVLPTFHPAYLLRNPADKRKVWEDMKVLKGRLDEM